MSITIGLVANVYCEANALPGWLETHTPFFDEIKVLHAGPDCQYSDDGTIEILEKWKIPTEFCAIDDGFGVVRTKALRMSRCDYIMLLDADERFYPKLNYLSCRGESTPAEKVDQILGSYHYRESNRPDWETIGQLGRDLIVSEIDPYNQGYYLRWLLRYHERDLGNKLDAICTIRRHWHDLAMRRPTQNWQIQPDWQMRLVRNDPEIHFDFGTKMHERLLGSRNSCYADMQRGPFFDHFHFFFKRMEEGQRAHDVAIYDKIHAGEKPPTREEFRL